MANDATTNAMNKFVSQIQSEIKEEKTISPPEKIAETDFEIMISSDEKKMNEDKDS